MRSAERSEAKKVYEQAKQEGKRASLVEQERPNIFTQNVANIEPGKKIDTEPARESFIQNLAI